MIKRKEILDLIWQSHFLDDLRIIFIRNKVDILAIFKLYIMLNRILFTLSIYFRNIS